MQTNGLNLLSEHDELNIEGIGLAKSMILFITKQYLAKENYGLDKELMRRYINRKGLKHKPCSNLLNIYVKRKYFV